MKAIFFFSLLLLAACHPGQKTANGNIRQGIRGVVTEVTGNQMPGPGVKRSAAVPLRTTVYVYELTNLQQVVGDEAGAPFYSALQTKEVAQAATDSKGRFALSLPPGSYSLFTKVDGKWYANVFDGANNIQPVTVAPDQVSELNITISAKAFF